MKIWNKYTDRYKFVSANSKLIVKNKMASEQKNKKVGNTKKQKEGVMRLDKTMEEYIGEECFFPVKGILNDE